MKEKVHAQNEVDKELRDKNFKRLNDFYDKHLPNVWNKTKGEFVRDIDYPILEGEFDDRESDVSILERAKKGKEITDHAIRISKNIKRYTSKRGVKMHKSLLKSVFESLGYSVMEEYKFAPTRKFRADWAIFRGEDCVLVEYEGIFCKKSRHTTYVGYTDDCEKYNLAATLGYTVLRYTGKNFDNVIGDVESYFTRPKLQKLF